MEEKKVVIDGGASASALLGIAFVILKLCNVIDWPWVWVTAPFWIPLALCIAFFAVVGIIVIIIAIIGAIASRY